MIIVDSSMREKRGRESSISCNTNSLNHFNIHLNVQQNTTAQSLVSRENRTLDLVTQDCTIEVLINMKYKYFGFSPNDALHSRLKLDGTVCLQTLCLGLSGSHLLNMNI